MPKRGLLDLLKDGETIIVAEGYIFEFERRGYLKSGSFVPEVVLEHPDLVKALHEEYIHAGSDVVLAFTYYAHREKLTLVGKEDQIERMNMEALRIAREIADKHDKLMAGNICNSCVYQPGNQKAVEKTKAMFKEQVEWAVRGGADYIVAETFGDYGEAALALETIKQYGNGLPAVVTLSSNMTLYTEDDVHIGEACRRLEEAGACVVGLNCGRGPATIIEPLIEVRKACKGPIACLPVPYRTNKEQLTFFSLTVPGTDKTAFPLDLSSCLCTRDEIASFAKEAKAIGTQYVGLCCGMAPHHFRIISEIYRKNAPASQYAPEVHKHYIFGDQSKNKDYFTQKVKSKLTKINPE